VYRRAAVGAVRASLAQSHGRVFAEEFVAQHMDAIHRAIMGRLNGRMESATRIELQALRRISQAGPRRE
jgi:hypothetical protein